MDPNCDPPLGDSSENLPPAGRRWLWIAVLMIGGAAPVFACAGAIYFLRQSIPSLTEETLAAARKKWEEHGPASYSMELELAGARPGRVMLQVADGVVIDLKRDGYAPPKRTWETWSIVGMFETLELELEIAADPVEGMDAPPGTEVRCQAEFDPTYGFPVRYRRLVVGDGPEIAWTVTKFVVAKEQAEE